MIDHPHYGGSKSQWKSYLQFLGKLPSIKRWFPLQDESLFHLVPESGIIHIIKWEQSKIWFLHFAASTEMWNRFFTVTVVGVPYVWWVFRYSLSCVSRLPEIVFNTMITKCDVKNVPTVTRELSVVTPRYGLITMVQGELRSKSHVSNFAVHTITTRVKSVIHRLDRVWRQLELGVN